MRIIPTRIHGVIDYLTGPLLIAAPSILKLTGGGPKTWVPVALGTSTVAYSAMTDYELGIVKAIPVHTHLSLDLGSGLLLAASPWLFRFKRDVWVPHLVVGLLEVGAALTTKKSPALSGRS